MRSANEIKTAVKERYGAIATSVAVDDGAKTCCGPSCCGDEAASNIETDPITEGIYDETQTVALPDKAVTASLGCGNPTALADLEPGQTVLDLGSGGGIDVLLSARRVAPDGFAYGLDMTDEMLELARRNQQEAGVANVEFLKGEIESIPLPDASVDVIISNCVINLSADKDAVLAEAWRVLRPGGRLAVSDVVKRRDVAPEVEDDLRQWSGCIAGALLESDYRDKLARARLRRRRYEPTRIYEEGAPEPGAWMSAFIRARKPEGA